MTIRSTNVASALLALMVLLGACGRSPDASPTSGDTTSPAGIETTPPGEEAIVAQGEDAVTPVDLPVGIDPVRLEIPALGVDARIVTLDLRGAQPEVPTDFADTGWYRQTRRPGELGPAVIAGHIDSKAGPAVFARLDELRPGDEIFVYDAAGDGRSFVVATEGQYSKDQLPPEVFNFDKPIPELRLITCGGVFDRRTGHYRDNFVIYAEAQT